MRSWLPYLGDSSQWMSLLLLLPAAESSDLTGWLIIGSLETRAILRGAARQSKRTHPCGEGSDLAGRSQAHGVGQLTLT